jgi:Peptidase family C25
VQRKRSARPKHGTVKLSVTVKRRLEHKYGAKLQQINTAIQAWINADAKRRICTVHVAVDDSAAMLKVWRDYFPKARRVRPVSGKVTAPKIKRAIADLWNRLSPDYLVLFGGRDIVPMFEVDNPSNFLSSPPVVDRDRKLATDNPYASSKIFRPRDISSYLVPDRVIGRIPDMMHSGDPAWLVDYLETASRWASNPLSFYRETYAICSSEMTTAGRDSMQYLSKPVSDLLISPPARDIRRSARNRLSARLHLIKCHGNPLDATFWGKGKRFVRAITSATLKAHLKPATLVGTMCCYGAQIFSPHAKHARSHGRWPIASTYLRKGALGFVGSTRMAWLGQGAMASADWIVADYLNRILEGASIGRAFLESKQKFAGYYTAKGRVLDRKKEKTMIEYVLLGDPSIHPADPSIHPGGSRMAGPESDLVAQERRQRRVVLSRRAEQVCKLLPRRARATPAQRSMAKDVFKRARRTFWKDDIKELKQFRIKSAVVCVEKAYTPLYIEPEARNNLGAIPNRQSLQFYWGGKRLRDGQTQICLITAETDLKGNVLRTSVGYSS